MTTWINLVAVAGGGACGAVARYLITWGATVVPGGSSVWGTLVANLLGCAAIGAFAEVVLASDPHIPTPLVLAVQVGFLGSLTTFSTFTMDAATMAGGGRIGLSGLYVLGNLGLGWTALMLSASLTKGWMS